MKTTRLLAAALLTVLLAAPVSASAGPADDVTLLQWGNKQGAVDLLTIGDKADHIPGAPSSFRSFARRELRATWQDYLGGRPACKGVPRFTVRGLRTDGFAFGYVNEIPRPGCQEGGGYVAIWAIRKGEWKQVIGTQDVPTCARLEALEIPSAIGVEECYDGTDVVDYVHD